MSYRFDNRTVDTFKQDIYFATRLERYFFNKWLDICKTIDYISVNNPRDNGVDNDGGFIESGKTSGADYLVDLEYNKNITKDMPLEIKWVPTYGKLSLKIGDLKSYIRDNAGILFIYLSEKTLTNIRKPKDYNLANHIQKIESLSDIIRWGIMIPSKVKSLLTHAEENNLIERISYMGYKPGIILRQNDFRNWFTEENWR